MILLMEENNMEDFKNTRDVMHYLFVKKTNDSIDSILEDTKKSLFNDIEYDYNPDIVIASVNTISLPLKLIVMDSVSVNLLPIKSISNG